ncbi:MAG: ferric reductase-like transmembrane domain-containing protein, partial [Minisyncoccia bacterium]
MEIYYAPPNPHKVKRYFVYALFFANLFAIFALWWTNSAFYIKNPEDGNMLIAIGRITGLIVQYFIIVQLLMIGRIKFVEHIFGFDKLNFFHRWLGYGIPILLIPHVLLLVIGKAQGNEVGFLQQLGDFLANKPGMLYAYMAFLLFIFVIFISLAIVRKKLKYETWYFVHVLTYFAIGFALQHQLGTGDLQNESKALTYWYFLNFTVFGLVLIYRLLVPLYLYMRHSFVVESVVQETPDVYSLYITGRNMESFKFEAGQYCNLTLLSKDMWYTHPFSFSAAYNGKFIRFTVKMLGDYTNKIKDVKPGTKVIIDGPLGLFVQKRAVRDKYLFIGGGIGITPLRSLIESMTPEKKDMVLLCGSRTVNDIAFAKEFEAIKAVSPGLVIHNILGTPTPG